MANEVLLWPPPPLPSEDGSPGSLPEAPVDLFILIHGPGRDGEETNAPGGLEILPNKVVFDSKTLYPNCTREVQKRIVGDLQRSYAGTSRGRELSVKEWADENQNRGILRLRLRCKKAKCKLQFQVNWDTVHKHWFITRQCENLVHTCPIPKPKPTSAAKRQNKANIAATPSPTPAVATSGGVKNGTHKTEGANHAEQVVTDEECNAFANAIAPPPVVEVVSSMPPPAAVAAQTPTPVPAAPPSQPQPPQPQHAPCATPPVTLSQPTLPAAPASAPPPMVVTEADRAEAELLATDLREWVPPPDRTNPQQQQQLPTAPPAIPPPHLAMYDEAALLHSGHPPLQTLSFPQSQPQPQPQQPPPPPPHHLPAPLQQPPQLPSPAIVQSSSKIPANTLPATSIQIPNGQAAAAPPPPSPLSPSRYMSGDAAMAANSMSIGANSVAMMSVEGDAKEASDVGVPVLDGTTNDGMSVLSESDDIMLTLGSTSSKQWMNGLPHIPHANLSRLHSDHYSSIGSWFGDTRNNSTNRPPSNQNIPPAHTTSTSTQFSSVTQGSTNNNMVINDQTMNSLTDSVRNMLSIVGASGATGAMPPVGEISSSQGSASFLLGSQRSGDGSKGEEPVAQPQGILATDFFSPPPSLNNNPGDVKPPPTTGSS